MWCLCGNTVVAVEIDEREHKHYVDGYEIVRYHDLLMDFTGRFVFLRINPDGYSQLGHHHNPRFEQRARIACAKLKEILGSVQRWGSSLGPTDANASLVEVHHLFYSK